MRVTTVEVSVVPGIVTVTGVPATVAQIHGCICGPEKMGPPREWFLIVRLDSSRSLPRPPLSSSWPLRPSLLRECALSLLLPSTRPFTTPSSRRCSRW
jgi:hypothetical protein